MSPTDLSPLGAVELIQALKDSRWTSDDWKLFWESMEGHEGVADRLEETWNDGYNAGKDGGERSSDQESYDDGYDSGHSDGLAEGIKEGLKQAAKKEAAEAAKSPLDHLTIRQVAQLREMPGAEAMP